MYDGMIKQSSFQLMDAVTNCWSSTVGRLVTKDNIFSIYSGSVNIGHQINLLYFFNDSITGGDHVKFYS